MPRRGNLEGTLRERTDGAWEGAIRVNGVRYWARGKSKREVQQSLRNLRRQHADDEPIAPSRITVEEHLKAWLEAYAGVWRPSTASGYEGIVRNYLVPAFGKKRLQSLSAADIAKQYAKWRQAGVGGRVRAIIHLRLHRALREAVIWGLLPRNPADNVEPPRFKYRRPTLWTPEQAARFAISLVGDSWAEALWALEVGCGLRLGEACALRGRAGSG